MSQATRLSIDQLEVGMYVEKVESSSPCPIKQAGVVRSEAIVIALKQYGVQHVLVNPHKQQSKQALNQPPPTQPPTSHPKVAVSEPANTSGEGDVENEALSYRVNKVQQLAQKAQQQLQAIKRKLIQGERIDYQAMEEVAHEISLRLSEDPVASKLLIKLHDGQSNLYEHSVNVAFLAGLFSYHMGFEQAICQQLILAGLLHDIGLITIPQNIIQNEKELNQLECNILHSHIQLGLEILTTQYQDISEICLSAIRHHHERIDGSGYPDKLSELQISFWGKIMAIVDSYESMTSSRIYASRLTNNQAMAVLIKESALQFDRSLVALFAQFIGAYPLGSFILCKHQQSQYVGLVVEAGKVDPLKPKILIFYDVDKRTLINKHVQDLSAPQQDYQLIRAINPEDYALDDLNMEFVQGYLTD